jgi:antitoxin component YwqK of YwqJK toxin-antitoxin module
MSGLTDYTVINLIEQIKASQKHVFKVFEEHNILVSKALEKLKELKTETSVVRVKDPLEEIKKFNDEVGTGKYHSKYSMITCLIDILCIYGPYKISSAFKDIFLRLFRSSLELDNANFEDAKKRILKVRDIRWLLLEMENYPQYFQFAEEDLELMKENGASRDNIYLVKRFLKKDGEYEEYYTEEKGGHIKEKFSMSGGKLNGLYQRWHPNGEKFQEYTFKDGKKVGLYQSWYDNGQKLAESHYFKDNKKEGLTQAWFPKGTVWYTCNFKEDKFDGLYKQWYENEEKMSELTYEDGNFHGFQQGWYENGQKNYESSYINGKLNGERREWNEQGKLILHRIYKDGKEIEVII